MQQPGDSPKMVNDDWTEEITNKLNFFNQMEDWNDVGLHTPPPPEGGYDFSQLDGTTNFSEITNNQAGFDQGNSSQANYIQFDESMTLSEPLNNQAVSSQTNYGQPNDDQPNDDQPNDDQLNYGQLNYDPKAPFPTLNQYFEPMNLDQPYFEITLPTPPKRISVDTTAPPVQQGVYQNQILNKFDSPETPLHVIDLYHSPQGFEADLQQLLADELQRENTTGSRFTHGTHTPIVKALTSTGKESKNRRPENIASFDPSRFYQPLPEAPTPWGSPDPLTYQPIFQYTKYGELTVGREYTTQQLCEYLFRFPYHGIPRFPGDGFDYRQRSALQIWIQNPPADSSKRYPEKGSDKCRWTECPVKDHTIHKGFYRVAFDELSRKWGSRGVHLDPYHNAGYMHLFCFEKMIDFPQISKILNVFPDTRELREGKNKMAITRDHKQMEEICNNYMIESVEFGPEKPEGWYQHSLCHALTEYQITHYANRVRTIMEERGGNNMTVHRGDCDLYAAGEEIKERKPMKPRAPDAKKPGRKRKFREPSPEDAGPADDEFIPDANILEMTDDLPSKRPAKRPRRSSRSPTGSSPDYLL